LFGPRTIIFTAGLIAVRKYKNQNKRYISQHIFYVLFIAYTPIKFPTEAVGRITNLADCRFDTPPSDNTGQRNSN